MFIDGQNIRSGDAPYVVAEISANHNGSFESAKKLVDVAVLAGASAVKLQTYTADTITLRSHNPDFQILNGPWKGKTLYELYDWAHTPWDWHKPLFDYARKSGITAFSSPFDKKAVDFLEDLNVPAYKIASFEIVDIPLIQYAATTGKPVIVSTGMASRTEIDEAVDAARSAGCKDLALLHCVSAYPAPAEEYNLRTIPDMMQRYKCPIGLSDHTLGSTAAIASVALGGSIVEKHVTLSRRGGGPDDAFSMEPDELSDLCQNVHLVAASLGKVNYDIVKSERGNEQFRRSLYFVKHMKKGERITPECIRSVRPGFGLAPKELEKVIGRAVSNDVLANTPVSYELISSP